MMRTSLKIWTLATVLAAPQVVSAAPRDPFLDSISILGGIDAGYHRIYSSTPAELDKHGYQFDLTGLATYSSKLWTIDLGGGWLYNRSQETSDSTALSKDVITTKAPFISAGGRYRLTPHWELGVRNRVLVGVDSRFQTAATQDNHVNWFVGPELVYRIPFWLPMQLLGTFLTDATISGRQIYQFLVGFQVGFPVLDFSPAPKPTPIPTPSPTPSPTPTPEATPMPVPTAPPPIVILEKRSYVFDVQRIEFDFNKATLRPRAKELLKDVGDFLKANSDAWGTLVVEGHTDSRGTAAYNNVLSKKRAESVRQELMLHGVPGDRIKAEGFGFSRPLAKGKGEEVWQRNRRVEFSFDGVRKPELLDEFIRKVNRDY